MTPDEAYETAIELLEFTILIWESGDADRQEEAEEAYRQAVGIRDKFL